MRAREFITEVNKVEENILGKLGKAAATGAKKIQPRLLGLDPTRPAVTNQLHNPQIGAAGFPAGSTQGAYNVRGIRRPEEIEDLLSTGFMNPSSVKKGKKYFTQLDDPQDMTGYYATVRVPSNKTPVGRAVRSKDVEIYDRGTGTWRGISPTDSPSARQSANWEKVKQTIPGMTSNAKASPKDAREAAMQHWMSQYGRPPMQSYGANTTGSLNNEMGRFNKLVNDYMNTDPRYWSNMQSFKIK
jgi:hypothetical protein